MTDGARIENLHIENAFFFLDSAPESTVSKLLDFLREQRDAGAFTIMGEDGYPVPEKVAEPDDTPTPEELIAAEAGADRRIVIKRADHLRSVAEHVTAARGLEGQRRGYASSLSKREGLEKRQKNAEKVAAAALEEACVLCEHRDDCELTGNIKRWIDVHAYAKEAKRRKDSAKVEAVESRKTFLSDLEAGVEAGEQIHCDPAER